MRSIDIYYGAMVLLLELKMNFVLTHSFKDATLYQRDTIFSNRLVTAFRVRRKSDWMVSTLYETVDATSLAQNLKMSAVTLYNNDLSPYCRVVRLVANSLGLQLNIKHVNSSAGETKTPQYLKMNPQHTVPTIDDGGFYLGESRAIICYLTDKYGGNNTLYPKDIKMRAIVNQRLYFDQDFGGKLLNYVLPIFQGKEPSADALEKANSGFEVLDMILKDNKWVAGDHLTIADHALCVTVELPQYAPKSEIEINKYKNISKWKAQVEAAIPKYKELQDEVLKALQKFKENSQ